MAAGAHESVERRAGGGEVVSVGRVVVVGPRHAECVECGALVHVPWIEGSSVELALQAWFVRLSQGCAECGGALRAAVIERCCECEEVLTS